MSDPAPNVTPLPKPEKSPAFQVSVDVNNPTSLYLDTAVFNQINRVATMMCSSKLAPKHLQGNDKIADAILVVAQALRWRSDPFAVAQHTFVLQGKLGYEGKLIAAMVNSSPKLLQNLDYDYNGEGEEREVIVSGQFKGSTKIRTVNGKVKDWKTTNEFWKKNPDQMLAYRGAREWARRHMPEVLLGVNSEEEVAPRTMVDVTPAPTTTAAVLNQALAEAAQGAAEDLRTVDGEVITERVTEDGEIVQAEQVIEEVDADTIIRKTDRMIEGILECETEAAIQDLEGQIIDDLNGLPIDERRRYAAAKVARQKAIKGKR